MKLASSSGISISLLSLWISSAVAFGKWEPKLCFDTCSTALHAAHFDDMLFNQTRLNNTCYSLRAMTSLYLCLDSFCTPEAREIGLVPLNRSCHEGTDTDIPPFSFISNWTAQAIAEIRRVEYDEVQRTITFREVILPSDHDFKVWYETLDAVKYIQHYHLLYAAAMVVFWLVAVAIGLGSHVMTAISNLDVIQHQSSKRVHRLWNSYTRLSSRVTVPATFGYRCAQKVGWGTVPPRIQSLTLLAFLLINIVFSIHGYRITEENYYFPTKQKQLLRFVSDRTGIISFANFPIIWLFGMRNNMLMWLTGWDFGTYNNFHRWVARIAAVQAIIHSIGYTWLIFLDGGWNYFLYWWTLMFWWAGELATIFMCLILVFSFFWVRRQHYETFLIVHIVMSIIVLVTMLGHVSIFQGEFDSLFWIPVIIWASDRILRGLRIFAFNRRFWNTRATATFNPSSNIIRLSIPWTSSLYKPAAGTYYYLHVLGGPRFWESHPFTVASVLNHGQTASKLMGEQVPLLETDDRDVHGDSGDLDDVGSDACTMTFLIRPYDGFTSRLREMASDAWPKKVPLRVLVDGPYGHTQPFHKFDNVVFVVGGSGIVVPLSYLQNLTGANSPRSVQIHWAFREPAFALEVLRNDIGDALGSPNLSVDIHFTSYAKDDMNDWPSQVTLHSGRIDARSTILDAREKADEGSLAIVACGPAQMADDARKTVVDLLGQGATRIEYFEESFQW